MGRYVNSNLYNGETVVFETTYHWMHYITLTSLLTLGIYPTIQKFTDEFVVTNRRIIIKKGLFNIYTLEMNLARMETVNVHQSIFGRIFGYGDITIIGTGGTRETFHCISQPLEFRRSFMEQI